MKRSYLPFLITVVIAITAGIAIGWLMRGDCKTWANESDHEIRNGSKQFPLINPLLECDNNQAIEELRPAKYKVEEYLAKNPNFFVSVYYRDLNNGPWFGINEKENFAPASLLKVPLYISYLKKSESDSNLLSQTIDYSELIPSNYSPVYQPERAISVGNKYSVEDLLNRMIVYSDNQAFTLLDRSAKDFWDIAYNDLGLTSPDKAIEKDFMSVKNYGSFFRGLFNASYLNKENSNKALEEMAKSTFKTGLVAGVPSNITVAHKFGERQSYDKKQLHDCGIVYYPNHPYLLCIMTRGNDFEQQTKIIKDISGIIYQDINSLNKNNKQ